jgi:hypothetical protein
LEEKIRAEEKEGGKFDIGTLSFLLFDFTRIPIHLQIKNKYAIE